MPQPQATRAPKHAGEARPTVHELQSLARQAGSLRRRRARKLSRAARLHLIDILSRWGGSGLALFAGVTIFVAVSAGRAYPLSAGAWVIMVLASLYVCRRLRKQFRAGERSASKPFRWRANYTASLCVLSAAFGAGGIVAIPAGAPPQFAYESFALLLAAALGAGLLHAGHAVSGLAAFLPAAGFVLLAVLRTGGATLAFAAFAAAALVGGAALFLFWRFLGERARRRFPRTGPMRQEVELASVEDAGAILKAHA